MRVGNIYLKSILSLLLLSVAASHSSFEHSHARRSLTALNGGLSRRQLDIKPLVDGVNGAVGGVGETVGGAVDTVGGILNPDGDDKNDDPPTGDSPGEGDAGGGSSTTTTTSESTSSASSTGSSATTTTTTAGADTTTTTAAEPTTTAGSGTENTDTTSETTSVTSSNTGTTTLLPPTSVTGTALPTTTTGDETQPTTTAAGEDTTTTEGTTPTNGPTETTPTTTSGGLSLPTLPLPTLPPLFPTTTTDETTEPPATTEPPPPVTTAPPPIITGLPPINGTTTDEPPVTTEPPPPVTTAPPPITTGQPPNNGTTTDEPPTTQPPPVTTAPPPITTGQPPNNGTTTDEPPTTEPPPITTAPPPITTGQPPNNGTTTDEPPITEPPPITTAPPPITTQPPVSGNGTTTDEPPVISFPGNGTVTTLPDTETTTTTPTTTTEGPATTIEVDPELSFILTETKLAYETDAVTTSEVNTATDPDAATTTVESAPATETSALAVAPLPVGIPNKIYPREQLNLVEIQREGGYSLISILFSAKLNWGFVVNNEISSSQIFAYAKVLIVNALQIPNDEVKTYALQVHIPASYKSPADAAQLGTIYLGYIPSELVEDLASQIKAKNSRFYTGVTDTVALALAQNVNSAFAVTSIVDPTNPNGAGAGNGNGGGAGESTVGATGVNKSRQDAIIGVVSALGAIAVFVLVFLVYRSLKRKRELAHRRLSDPPNEADFAGYRPEGRDFDQDSVGGQRRRSFYYAEDSLRGFSDTTGRREDELTGAFGFGQQAQQVSQGQQQMRSRHVGPGVGISAPILRESSMNW